MFAYWAKRFRWDYTSRIDAFSDALLTRVLPAFANIGAESQQIAEEVYRSLTRGLGEDEDPADYAEHAQNEAISYSETMTETRQGIVNMFAAGLWHLFEQQLADLVRTAILSDPVDNPNFSESETAIRTSWHIDITTLPSCKGLDELRLLANCGKHGDGPSCNRLRQLRPTLFTMFPPDDPINKLSGGRTRVIAPFGGEHLYVTDDDFRRYVAVVKAFWTEFSEEIRKRYPGR